jgi:hypothetical protein
MRSSKAIIASALAAALLAGSASEASARWVRGPGPVLGLFGALAIGAATIATAPIAIIAGAARYAPPPRTYYYAPPPRAYYYPPRPPVVYAPPPPPSYYYPPPAYGPPPGYYRY